MYADDKNMTVCGETGKGIETKSNSELEDVHKWLLANKLTLNVNKTEYMIIGSRQRLAKIADDVKVDVGGKDVQRVTSTKSLRVIIDDTICWTEQIDRNHDQPTTSKSIK